VFSRYRVTVHVPRRPYAEALPGIPTIRPFEAMACGIPLISAPWQDTEKLFRGGTDFLFASSGAEMAGHI
jgi:spore maturation protein CgeB